ncbi:cupin-like domain-containing protein [Dactylosporangium sp. AC04546]|uniref:cupin-like domain-containing protein n=1 Tax=Dactylosporangium sp. AC04546 TaxID=2862460 RepID=UPI001EDFAB7C|nr:cupin-like domain-containing protein [Dactylosporangium sp. AC04546]WVK80015.1 cupin-like domain-containing protein [Dactylosporangium sp. AC04546]
MTTTVPAVAAEWQEWIARNLALGVPPDSLLDVLREAGVDAATARAEIDAALAHPYFRACRSLAESSGWVEALLETYGDLRTADGGRTLQRRHSVAPDEFFERYYFGHRPVVLQGLTDDWPARHWTLAGLRERFGAAEVEVMTGRDADADHGWRYDTHRTPMSFGDYLTMVETGGRTNDYYMVPRNENWQRPELSAMRAEVRPPAGLVPPDVTPDDMTLLIGPAGTVTPLHHDNMNILLCQVMGRKHVRLVPSWDRHRVYPRGGTFSHVDAWTPDLRRFPDYAAATVLETVLEPGEALFIPVCWWHWVRALDVSITVSFHRFTHPASAVYLTAPA